MDGVRAVEPLAMEKTWLQLGCGQLIEANVPCRYYGSIHESKLSKLRSDSRYQLSRKRKSEQREI